MRRGHDRSDIRGQATAEVVLVLPVVVTLGLVVAQAALVAIDLLLLHHVTREAARAVAVDPSAGAARAAAVGSTSLDAGRLAVSLSGGRSEGDVARVEVRYASPTDVPLVGWMVGDVPLRASAAIRVE